jgi:hypothetical protein
MPENTDTEGFESLPDYVLKSPLMYKYAGIIHQLIDMMHEDADESLEYDMHFEIFRDCFMTVYRRIAMDGDIHGMDNLLKLHFPDYYPHCEMIGMADLATHPLSTDN